MTSILKIKAMLTKSQLKSAYALLVMMIVGMLMEMLSIGLVVPVVSLMLQTELLHQYQLLESVYRYFNYPSQDQVLVGVVFVLLFIYLIKNGYLALLAWKQSKFAYDVQQETSQLLFNSYLKQPYSFHLQRNTAQLIRNTIGEVTIFTASINSHLIIISESLVLIGIVSLLIYVQPLGALVLMLVLGSASFLFFTLTKTQTLKWGKARQYHEGKRLQHLQQGLGAVKDVLLMGRGQNFQDQYSVHNAESANAARSQYALQQMPKLWLEFLAILGLAILVMVMVNKSANVNALIPTLALFAASAFRLIPSANKIITSLQSLRFSLPVINNLYSETQIWRNYQLPTAHVDSFFPEQLQKEITVNQLAFTYPNSSLQALKKVNLSIKKGESVGIIGASGSGKSTLIDILMGLLTPNEGAVMVDGFNIQSNLRQWQQQIGYVPQSIYLTDNTIRRNIAFGLADADIDEISVQRALKMAQLEDLITTLPEGLETAIGERGVKLSGGQKQRIGIARALYHDPDVLVFDEATSALDNETEAEVIKAIEFLQKTKTIVIIAHRLSTVAHCDRVYKMSAGKVISEEKRSSNTSNNSKKKISSKRTSSKNRITK